MTERIQWTLEDDVNDYVKRQLDAMGKLKNRDYTVESSMSQYMREALAGSAKTQQKLAIQNMSAWRTKNIEIAKQVVAI